MKQKTEVSSRKSGNILALDEQKRRVFLKFVVTSKDTATPGNA